MRTRGNLQYFLVELAALIKATIDSTWQCADFQLMDFAKNVWFKSYDIVSLSPLLSTLHSNGLF